ncbi:O-antigen/teichoic acid export membrane protein [Longibaculum muris]|uniref:O-antigen/teichoic acid export membrane protein n=2 Tax=Longibaculum muris TaxID=1796628 RepID=A0A4V2W5Y7_9FIRM|nr:flippase [Longibaculum muris]KXU41360.1 polysaccharide biosynthesis protein [Candidatus Stoquefichus sp. KLE1796]MBS5370391.1 flippase [Coprobacillus cateniformis]MCR1886891.1 flippase [Longibaculum muris]TCW02922.1 O-antigen/teichoic acid export membrane protein [Longibaculum muris]
MSNSFKIHSVKYNFIMNMILRMSSFIFPMITFPYVSRVLLAVGNGKIAFAASVINYFSLFASLGIPTYGVKVCAQVRDDKTNLSRTVHELLFINFICMIISYIVFIIMMFVVPEFSNNSTLLWINSISILLSVAGIEWFYQSIEQYDYITFRNIAFKVLSILLMFLFVHDKSDYIIYGAITILGTVGSNILNIIKLPKYITLKKIGNYCIKKHIKPIIFLFLYSAATMIYTNLDTVMLGFISGDIQVGYYNAAIKLKNILVSVVTALGSVLMPRISYYLTNNFKEKFYEMIKKSFEFIFLIAIPLATYFYFEADSLIIFLAGNGYEQAIPVMRAIIPSIIFIGIGSVTAWQLLIPLGKETYTVLGAIMGGLVDLIINILLIPTYGAIGAAIGTLVAEMVVVSVHLIVLRNELKHISIKKDIIKIFISLIITMFCYYVLINCFSFINIFVRLVITFIVFFGVYLLILFFTRENIIYEYSTVIFGKILHK